MTARPHPGLIVAVLIAFAILVSLGVWQLYRLDWKRDLIGSMNARLAAPAIAFDEAAGRAAAGERMDYRPVFLVGRYAHELETFVFGTLDGVPGVYIFTPLAPSGTAAGPRYVFVNRGFAPQDFRAPGTRAEGLVAGEVRVEGLFRSAEERHGPAKWLAPEDQIADNLYFIRNPRTLAASRSLDVSSYYIDSRGRESAGPWPKGGVTRVEFPNRHLEYALTWFGLAGALIAVFIAWRRKRG